MREDLPVLSIGLVTVVVPSYDQARQFYVDTLGLELVQDVALEDGKRWLVVGTGGASLLLAEAADDEQLARVGNQTGGRVAFFLSTDDFAADHPRLLAAGVRFLEQPRHEPYGDVAVFEDLYGNRWDLVEHRR